MSIGPSGRIVIEVETELKRALHSALLKDGMTLKDWFISMATQFTEDRKIIKLGQVVGGQLSDSQRQQTNSQA